MQRYQGSTLATCMMPWVKGSMCTGTAKHTSILKLFVSRAGLRHENIASAIIYYSCGRGTNARHGSRVAEESGMA